MSALILFLATFFFLLIIFTLLMVLRRPVYRITRENVIRLFELVLAGEATEDDLNVFVEMPIRYDESLELVRMRSTEILESDDDHRFDGFLLSANGLQKLEVLLAELKNAET